MSQGMYRKPLRLVCHDFFQKLERALVLAQALFTRGESGKLGGERMITGGRHSHGKEVVIQSEAAASKDRSSMANDEKLSWLLTLAKTTASLAGRLAATLVIGDCGISPFLETYFSAPAYATWMESDLFSAGCDPFYESLLLAPLDISSQDESSCVTTTKPPVTSTRGGSPATSGFTAHWPKRNEFVEEVAGGYGTGGRFLIWVSEALCPLNASYRVIKRQASAGQDGSALERAERAMMAAMLRHAGLDGEAAFFSFQLDRRDGVDEAKGFRMVPRRFARLWKAVSEARYRSALSKQG